MSDRPVCKSTDHLFVPVVEVTIPLLRCIHCNVFAYQETVKELARNRRYTPEVEPSADTLAVSFWQRLRLRVRRYLDRT
jgi:hypothetical protein